MPEPKYPYMALEDWKAKAAASEAPTDVILRKATTIENIEPLDGEPNTLRITITTNQQDRQNDVIEVDGWDLSDYTRNPVVLWAHEYHQVPVARSPRIDRYPDRLVGFPEFTPRDLYPFGHMVGQMLRQGFLNASSVGFAPREWVFDEELSGVHFYKQFMLEWSVVPIPANAGCLVEARSVGIDVEPLKDWAERVLDDWHEQRGLWLPRKVVEEAYVTVSKGQLISVPRADIHAEVAAQTALVEKRGRVLSRANETAIREAVSDIQQATTRLGGVLEKLGGGEMDGDDEDDDEKSWNLEPLRWNLQLSKAFDVAAEPLPPSRLEYGWVSRFLGVSVQELSEQSEFIPSARMPSFLAALDDVLGEWHVEALRHINDNGHEGPPLYEAIQLNSRETRTFLIGGTRFLRHVSDAAALVIKVEPHWAGVALTTFATHAEAPRQQAFAQRVWATAAELNFLKGEAFTLGGEFLTRGGEDWPDVFLEAKPERTLRRAVELLNEHGEHLESRGILLLGEPGTGKTLSGRIMMNQAEATFVWVSARDFYRAGAFGGLAYAFDIAAECAPTILFIEDVDHWLSEWSIDLLKTEMDGIKRRRGIVTVLTTNYPERLPAALIDRPGRFHDLVELSLPTEAVRRRMLQAWVPEIDPSTLTHLVTETQGFSGAHLRELVMFAQTIQAEESLTLAAALTEALEKVHAQRQLVSHLQGKPRQRAVYRPSASVQRAVRQLQQASMRRMGVLDLEETGVKQDGFQIQTLIFPKSKWEKAAAQKWCRDHDYQDGVDETEDSYRMRQEDPDRFSRLRTICLTPADTNPGDEACRIKAVGGPHKEAALIEPGDGSPAQSSEHALAAREIEGEYVELIEEDSAEEVGVEWDEATVAALLHEEVQASLGLSLDPQHLAALIRETVQESLMAVTGRLPD